MRESFINPICPICGEVECGTGYKCPFHLMVRADKFYGCSICFSPIILGRVELCSNPACFGWRKEENDMISYKNRLIFSIYPGTDNIYYIYDTPMVLGMVKLFYQQLYYTIVDNLSIPRKDFMYVL